MVRRGVHSFVREESGISLTEALFTFPIVMLIFAAFVEFGYAMHQWNQTAKAAQFGARRIAVSDPILGATELALFNAAAVGTAANTGATIPVGAAGPWFCGADTGIACDTAKVQRIVYGNAGASQCYPIGTTVASMPVRPAMCHINPRIEANNIAVSYSQTGLGYYGRPFGVVVTIRVEVRNVSFDLPILGSLLGLNTITVPVLPVTITSEDLSTTPI